MKKRLFSGMIALGLVFTMAMTSAFAQEAAPAQAPAGETSAEQAPAQEAAEAAPAQETTEAAPAAEAPAAETTVTDPALETPAPETTVTDPAAETPSADGSADAVQTDPAQAYTGVWVSDRISLFLDKQGSSCFAVVYWPSSAAEITYWSYREAVYDSIAQELNTAEIGEKCNLVYGEDGRVKSFEREYSDGAASFKLNEEGKLVWTDYKVTPGLNTITFEKTAVERQIPAAEDFAEKYFRPVANAEQDTIAKAAGATVRFAVQSQMWPSDTADLETSMRMGWESLTDYERSAFEARFMTTVGTVISCMTDWEALRDRYEADGSAQDLEMIAYDPMNQYSYRNLFTLTCGLFAPVKPDESAVQADDGLHSSVQKTADSPDWVKALPSANEENVKQILVVAGLGADKTAATVTMHQKEEDGSWKQILSTPAWIGINGMCPGSDLTEGSGQTPAGIYHFTSAFGIAADPGSVIPYTCVTDGSYWSGDAEHQYNRLVDIKDVPELDLEKSMRIADYEYQNQYCLSLSYNEEGTPGKGTGIFLCCLDMQKPFTNGSVAVPENMMKMILQKASADCAVVIDTAENLGGSF